MSIEFVEKAAQFLDGQVGKFHWLTSDWRSKIDIDNLYMLSCKRCILGQLEGDYDNAYDKLLSVSGWFDVMDAFGSYTEDWKAYLRSHGANGVRVGNVYIDEYSEERTIKVIFVEDDIEHVVYKVGSSLYVRKTDEFLKSNTLKPQHDFKKGDILTASDGKIFVYISDAELVRLSPTSSFQSTGYGDLKYFRNKYGSLAKVPNYEQARLTEAFS